jgi:hypothetical protein
MRGNAPVRANLYETTVCICIKAGMKVAFQSLNIINLHLHFRSSNFMIQSYPDSMNA